MYFSLSLHGLIKTSDVDLCRIEYQTASKLSGITIQIYIKA